MTTENAAVLSPVMAAAPPERAGRLSWGGLTSGLFVALAVWVLLTVLGLAVSLAAIEPSNPAASLRGVGTAAGIWSVVAWIGALFAGGAVAGHAAGILERPRGAIHGFVLWSLATVLSIFLVAGLLRTVVRGALATAESAVAAAGAVGAEAGQVLELDVGAVLRPINNRLLSEGRSPISPAEVQAALQDVTVSGLQAGRLDKSAIVRTLTEKTSLSPGDADDLADSVVAWFDERAAVAQDVRGAVLSAASTTGKALWWVFFGMTLGLGASLIGSTLGTGRRQKRAAALAVMERPPLETTREAHA